MINSHNMRCTLVLCPTTGPKCRSDDLSMRAPHACSSCYRPLCFPHPVLHVHVFFIGKNRTVPVQWRQPGAIHGTRRSVAYPGVPTRPVTSNRKHTPQKPPQLTLFMYTQKKTGWILPVCSPGELLLFSCWGKACLSGTAHPTLKKGEG